MFRSQIDTFKYTPPPMSFGAFSTESEQAGQQFHANPSPTVSGNEVETVVRRRGFVRLRNRADIKPATVSFSTVLATEVKEVFKKISRTGWSHREVYEATIEHFDGVTLSLQSTFGRWVLETEQFEFLCKPKRPLEPGGLLEVHLLCDRRNPKIKKLVIDTLELEELPHEEVLQILRDSGVSI
jgi:hypothetical protein